MSACHACNKDPLSDECRDCFTTRILSHPEELELPKKNVTYSIECCHCKKELKFKSAIFYKGKTYCLACRRKIKCLIKNQ